MEPLSALSLAVNIIQVVDFSAKVIDTAVGIHRSTTGMTENDQNLENTVQEMRSLSHRLIPPTTAPVSEGEKALRRLAGECRSLSDQILELLGKIQPEDPKSKRQVSISAFKYVWSAREKNELEMRLESCRNQLHLQLSYMTSADTRARLMGLESSVENQHDQLEKLREKLESLRAGTSTTSLGDEAQKQIQSLLKVPDTVRIELIQRHILKGLAFPEMRTRLDGIEEAHEKTFRWILDGGNIKEDQRKSHELFNDWLLKGDGIFHVSGKLGSGKSTLMKFLCDDEATRAQLSAWAGAKRLVFANFFFWKAGSTLQSSLIGLMRSFLYDILKACPNITYTLFKKEWGSLANTSLEYSADEILFRDKDIRDAFHKLINHSAIYETHRFCFFIDGLDEYEETLQISKKHVVNLFNSWVSDSKGCVKLCVSSREDNLFLNAFSIEKRIRLQDLTKDDMRKYVREMLSIFDGTEKIRNTERDALKENMVEYSDGIFLWLALVVKEIDNRLQDDPTISFDDLKRELEDLPRELETLFEHLLVSIPKADRRLSYQLFDLVSNPKVPPSLLACSFLDDYENDPDFITRPSFPINMNQTAIEARLALGRIRINRRGKGLIEVREDRTAGPVLAFTHRSVHDFLQKPIVQEESKIYLGDFCREDVFLQLLLALLRAIDRNDSKNWQGNITRVEFLLTYSRQFQDLRSLGVAYCPELDKINNVINEKYTFAERRFYLDPYYGRRLPYSAIFWHRWVNNVVLFECAMRGALDYVEWKVSRDSMSLTFEEGCMLLNVLREGACDDWVPLDDEDMPWRIAIMILLLKSSNWSWDWNFRMDALQETDLRPARFWMYFICYAIHSYNVATQYDSLFGELIAAFVGKGADPRLHVDRIELIGYHNGDVCKLVPILPYVDLGEDAWWEDRFRIVKQQRINPVQKHILRAKRPVSLREIVEMWDFINKDELLALIDNRIGELERTENATIYLEANSFLAPDVHLAKYSYIFQPHPIGIPSKPGVTVKSHNPYFPPLEPESQQVNTLESFDLSLNGMKTGGKRESSVSTSQDRERAETTIKDVVEQPDDTVFFDKQPANIAGFEESSPQEPNSQKTQMISSAVIYCQRLQPLVYIFIGVLLTLMFDHIRGIFRG